MQTIKQQSVEPDTMKDDSDAAAMYRVVSTEAKRLDVTRMGPFWHVGGGWTILQDNGFGVGIYITQNREQLSANAMSSRGVKSIEATGSMRGIDFELHIHWQGGTRGVYKATVHHGWFTQPSLGYLSGETYDEAHPSRKVKWHSEYLVCKWE